MFPRPGDALAGDARHGEASQKSLSAFHRPQYKFRVLLPLRLTEARKTPGVWRDFFVGSLLSVENPIISGPKQAQRGAWRGLLVDDTVADEGVVASRTRLPLRPRTVL